MPLQDEWDAHVAQHWAPTLTAAFGATWQQQFGNEINAAMALEQRRLQQQSVANGAILVGTSAAARLPNSSTIDSISHALHAGQTPNSGVLSGLGQSGLGYIPHVHGSTSGLTAPQSVQHPSHHPGMVAGQPVAGSFGRATVEDVLDDSEADSPHGYGYQQQQAADAAEFAPVLAQPVCPAASVTVCLHMECTCLQLGTIPREAALSVQYGGTECTHV
jgi:hypothetical protein